MAAEKVGAAALREIPLSLKCILIGAALVGAGYYVYKHKSKFGIGR